MRKDKYKHFKGRTYIILCEGVLESDPENPDCTMTVYMDSDAKIWIRPSFEFHGYVEVPTPGGFRMIRRFAPLEATN